jgi:hypothetical protein
MECDNVIFYCDAHDQPYGQETEKKRKEKIFIKCDPSKAVTTIKLHKNNRLGLIVSEYEGKLCNIPHVKSTGLCGLNFQLFRVTVVFIYI